MDKNMPNLVAQRCKRDSLQRKHQPWPPGVPWAGRRSTELLKTREAHLRLFRSGSWSLMNPCVFVWNFIPTMKLVQILQYREALRKRHLDLSTAVFSACGWELNPATKGSIFTDSKIWGRGHILGSWLEHVTGDGTNVMTLSILFPCDMGFCFVSIT